MGASSRARRLRLAAATTSRAAATHASATMPSVVTSPVTLARIAARGLRASTPRSLRRVGANAQERPPALGEAIQPAPPHPGVPVAALDPPADANGCATT